jgi:hypothetical protein
MSKKKFDATAMTPREFLVWFQGVVDMVGDGTPSETQWARLREVAEGVIGRIVAEKMISSELYPDHYTSKHTIDDNALMISKLRHINDMLLHETPMPIYKVGDTSAPPVEWRAINDISKGISTSSGITKELIGTPFPLTTAGK